MADENDGAATDAAAEAEYRSQLKAMLSNQDPAPASKPAEPKPEDGGAGDEPADDAADQVEDDEAGEGEGDDAEADEGDEDEATDDEEEDGGEGDEDDDGEEDPAAKAKYSAALLKLQKKEKSLEAFKATVLAKEKDISAREERVKSSERELVEFIERLKLDPFNTLLEAKLISEDDAEYLAKQLHYHSPEAAKDPRSKAEAERLRRERAQLLETRKTRAEVERLRKEREEERTAAAQKAELDNYVAKVDEAAATYKAKNPVLAAALEKNPTKTRRELLQIANELSAAKGEFADPKLVVLAWTKQRKELLAELGIAGPAATKKAKSKSAVEKKGPVTEASKKTDAAPPANAEAKAEAEYRRKLKAMLAGEE